MRPLLCLSLLGLCVCCFAAAPPAKVPAAWQKLIDQLGDDNEDVRKSAEKQLTALGEDVLPALHRAEKQHDDVDVRLRAAVLATAIEAKTYVEVRRFVGHTDGIVCFAVSPDGKRVVSGSGEDNTEYVARVWNLGTGKQLFRLKHRRSVLTAAWSHDGKRILTGGADGSVRLWDAATGKGLKKLAELNEPVYGVALTPDGKKAVTCGQERTIRVWDLTTGKLAARNDDHGKDVRIVRSVAVTPDGKHLVSAALDGTVRIISLDGRQVKKIDAHAEGANYVAVSPDGKRIASCGADNAVRLWDVRTGEQVRAFEGHDGEVHAIAFSRDGRRLISASYDATARVWEVDSGKEVRLLRGHQGAVMQAAFVGDGHALTGGLDGNLRLWKIPR